MSLRITTLLFLLAIIVFALASSSLQLKEGLELAHDWKTKGQGVWHGSVQLPSSEVEPSMAMFANTASNAACCKNNPSFSTSGGCLCISPQQYTFLKQRGGNNTQPDGLNDGY